MKDKAEYSLSESSTIRLNSILKDVLSEIKPSPEEVASQKYAINDMMGRLKKYAPKNVEILLAGSVARGTNVRGKSDIDIFLLFPRSLSDKFIEKEGLEIGKRVVNKRAKESYIIKYAEHPYVRILLKNTDINFDIVPAYKIYDASERGTAVDRTQLHNEFINSSLSEKQRDDVRLLKSFLKAHRVYGAEAKIEGFSGYLCELLVLYYGSFIKTIEHFSNAQLPIVMLMGKYKPTEDHSAMIKKFGKKFIVIDPTDSNRNVAANVSEESFFRFVIASRHLIKNPSKEMFFSKAVSNTSYAGLEKIKKSLNANIHLISFKVPDIANEIIWQQLKKTRIRLDDMLKRNGFAPLVSLQSLDKKTAIIGFFISDIEINAVKTIGPSIDMGDAVTKFREAHKGSMTMFIDNDRVYSIDKSKYSRPEDLIKDFLKDKKTNLPSYIKAKSASFYMNKIPEKYAKLLYQAYHEKFSF